MRQKKTSLPTLDLHGRKTNEIFDLMDRFLRAEEAKGTACVRILHGRGSGKVKAKTEEYCKATGHQPKPDRGENGQANPGAFLLFL